MGGAEAKYRVGGRDLDSEALVFNTATDAHRAFVALSQRAGSSGIKVATVKVGMEGRVFTLYLPTIGPEMKSERSSDTVPIAPSVAKELKAHRLRHGRPGDHTLVFTGEGGARLDETNYRRRVLDLACARAGLAPIGFHVLRHTHGTIVAAATRDVRAVQRRLRHTSAAFTLETYIHLLDDRAGVDAVHKALESGSKRPRR